MPKPDKTYLHTLLVGMICMQRRAGNGWQYAINFEGNHLFLHKSGLFFIVADECESTPLAAERICAAAMVAVSFNQVGWHDVVVTKVDLDVEVTLNEHAEKT